MREEVKEDMHRHETHDLGLDGWDSNCRSLRLGASTLAGVGVGLDSLIKFIESPSWHWIGLD
jgi:hypothetical protein